jgi:hypothetical protein
MTLLYIAEEVYSAKDKAAILRGVEQWARATPPLRCETTGVALFDSPEEPLVATIKVAGGAQAYSALREAVEASWRSFKTRYDWYPHVTLQKKADEAGDDDHRDYGWTAGSVTVQFGRGEPRKVFKLRGSRIRKSLAFLHKSRVKPHRRKLKSGKVVAVRAYDTKAGKKAESGKPKQGGPEGWGLIPGGKQAWEMTRAEFVAHPFTEQLCSPETAKLWHTLSIHDAIQRRRAIPANVLADYPEEARWIDFKHYGIKGSEEKTPVYQYEALNLRGETRFISYEEMRQIIDAKPPGESFMANRWEQYGKGGGLRKAIAVLWKAHVKPHTRKLAGGKTVQVKGYDAKRTKEADAEEQPQRKKRFSIPWRKREGFTFRAIGDLMLTVKNDGGMCEWSVWAAESGKPVRTFDSGELRSTGDAKKQVTALATALMDAREAWLAGSAYVDNRGAFHVRPKGRRGGNGPVASWNKAVQEAGAKEWVMRLEKSLAAGRLALFDLRTPEVKSIDRWLDQWEAARV